MRPLSLEPAATPWRRLVDATFRERLLDRVATQLRARGAEYVDAWSDEDGVDLRVAFKVASVLKAAWLWPNDFFVPADPFALLNPARATFLDDGMDAVEVTLEIERALGLPALSDAFWSSAYSRTLAEVIRLLQSEMAARGGTLPG